MPKNYFINPGGWSHVRNSVKGALDLRKWLREALVALNVPAADSCCPTVTDGQPVRYNAALQYFNGTTWVSAGAASTPATGTYANLVTAPTTATSPGIAGQIAYATGFFYVCVATNTWQRVAIAGGF